MTRGGDGPREACGIFGVWGDPEAVGKTYYGIFALQHRGQESAGIASTDGRTIQRHRGMGTVAQVFAEDAGALERIKGPAAMGHVRYSTMGASLLQNAQPLVAVTQWGPFAVAHNGNFTNAPSLRTRFEAGGAIFQTTTDSEVFLHLLARPGGPADPVERMAQACREIEGAYSLLVMTPRALVGIRDPQGFRPLWLGQNAEGKYGFASETPAFDLTKFRPLYEVPPGTLVEITDAGVRQVRFAEPKLAHCVFEHVYFSRPDGVIFGDAVQTVRKALGRVLAREKPADADIVIAIPDSGNAAAQGYSLESGIPLEHGFIRNHYIGRTFIQPSAAARAMSADLKLNVVRSVVEGKRVIVVDDSVVRGTTARRRCHYLREAGATEVHLRVSCPPIKSPCFYGVDFQSKGELIAAEHSIEEMARLMEVDSLGYLTVEGMLSVLSNPASAYCTACWTGNYPVPIEEGTSKKSCGEGPAFLA
jgi:amidophosphoribosyltransferase